MAEEIKDQKTSWHDEAKKLAIMEKDLWLIPQQEYTAGKKFSDILDASGKRDDKGHSWAHNIMTGPVDGVLFGDLSNVQKDKNGRPIVDMLPYQNDPKVTEFYDKNPGAKAIVDAYANHALDIAEQTKKMESALVAEGYSLKFAQKLSASVVKNVDDRFEAGKDGSKDFQETSIIKDAIKQLPNSIAEVLQSSPVEEDAKITLKADNHAYSANMPSRYDISASAADLKADKADKNVYVTGLAANQNEIIRIATEGTVFVDAGDLASSSKPRRINTSSGNLTVAFTEEQLQKAEIETNLKYEGIEGTFTRIRIGKDYVFTTDNMNIAIKNDKGEITNQIPANEASDLLKESTKLKLEHSDAQQEKKSISHSTADAPEAQYAALPRAAQRTIGQAI